MKRPEDVVNAWSAVNSQNPRLRAIAIYLVKEFRHYVGCSQSPSGIGAAAIYLASQIDGMELMKLTQREICYGIPRPNTEGEHLGEAALRNVAQRMKKGIPDWKERGKRFAESLPS